jgi:hypothetical protein
VRHREEHKNVTRLTMENVSALISQSPTTSARLANSVLSTCSFIDELGVSV